MTSQAKIILSSNLMSGLYQSHLPMIYSGIKLQTHVVLVQNEAMVIACQYKDSQRPRRTTNRVLIANSPVSVYWTSTINTTYIHSSLFRSSRWTWWMVHAISYGSLSHLRKKKRTNLVYRFNMGTSFLPAVACRAFKRGILLHASMLTWHATAHAKHASRR